MPSVPGPSESASTFIREKAPDMRPNPSPTENRHNKKNFLILASV